MTSDVGRIIQVGADQFDDAVETLCESFHDYPVMRYVLGDAGDDYDRQLTLLTAYLTNARLTRDWPVLGVLHGSQVIATVTANPPQTAPPPPALVEQRKQLQEELGSAAIGRLQAFADATDPFAPEEPHYYVGMLGVRKAFQGQGHAGRLLDAMHRMSGDDPQSTGVLLTTEDPDNVPLYRHFGYEVIGTGKAEQLVSWVLFRPDPG